MHILFRKHTPDPAEQVRPRRSVLLRRGVATAAALLFIAGGAVAWRAYSSVSALTGTKNPVALVASVVKNTPLKTTGGRTNILLAGYSADDAGHQGAELTDSIMIISIDATDHSVVMISVPRDLYVNIPGYGYSKINAAYEDGEKEGFSVSGYPTGGMGLLEETISQDFGISFNYDTLIDYTAFKDAVDAVGGVTIAVNSSDSRGLYDPNTDVQLPNGTVTLDGAQALNLARARGDGYGSYGFPRGDFDRTEHQQQLLVALEQKAGSLSTLANPLKLTSLLDALSSNVKTDFTLGELRTLYDVSKDIPSGNVTQVTLNDYDGQNLLSDYLTPSGQDALVPAAGLDDYSDIQSVVSNLLQPPTQSSGDSAGSQ